MWLRDAVVMSAYNWPAVVLSSSLPQWLESPVVGSIPIWNSEYFAVFFSPHIISFINNQLKVVA